MKELILKLSIEAPYGFPWERTLKSKNIELSKEEIIVYLRDLHINNMDVRKEFSWSVELAIYESAAQYTTLDVVVQKTKAKLSKFKHLYPYISDEVITYVLDHKGLNTEKNLEVFKKALENILTDKEKGEYKNLVAAWLVEIITWNVMLKGFETAEEINEQVFKLTQDKYSYLKIDKENLKVRLGKLGIGIGKNIELFKSSMKENKDRYEALLIKEKPMEKLDIPNSLKEEDLMDSIFGIFENMEEKKEVKIKHKKPKIEVIKELQEDIEPQSKIASVYEGKEVEVFNKLAALAEVLGYALVDNTKIQVSREYYEKLNSTKGEEDQVIKQLLSLEKGAVLSQLYNTYKNLNRTSLDNIEAVMANFFSSLLAMGFEVNEDKECVGQTVTVNTKDLFKDYVFSKPVNKDGEINGQVQYLSWSYKDKTIMPKVIKPIE